MSKVTTLTAEQWAWVRSERDRIISEARANGPADRERVEVITSFVVRPKPASRNSAASLTEKGETVRFTRVRQLHPQQWRERAACRGIDLDVFVLPPSLTSGSAPPATLERLQADADATIERYCAGCPVITACRDAAIDEGDTDAIRGGMTPRQRRAWVKARKAHHARGLALLNELRKVSA